MVHLRAVQPMADAPARIGDPHPPRASLYKADHPRRIDRCIDFFGDGAPAAQADADRCGEVFLASLA